MSLSLPEFAKLMSEIGEALLVTENGELHFVAESLDTFEGMMRWLRLLEAESKRRSRP